MDMRARMSFIAVCNMAKEGNQEAIDFLQAIFSLKVYTWEELKSINERMPLDLSQPNLLPLNPA
jgi:hypothetical protein